MRVEARYAVDPNTDKQYLRGVVLVATNEKESLILDKLGKMPDDDGVLARGEYTLKLSDGYDEHYVYLTNSNTPS
jgi:hypothetical protein